jgi:hypothetical protein
VNVVAQDGPGMPLWDRVRSYASSQFIRRLLFLRVDWKHSGGDEPLASNPAAFPRDPYDTYAMCPGSQTALTTRFPVKRNQRNMAIHSPENCPFSMDMWHLDIEISDVVDDALGIASRRSTNGTWFQVKNHVPTPQRVCCGHIVP